MLRVVIIGYGEMFTNLIAATLDAKCEIVGVLSKDSVKYNRLLKKLKDIFNPSLEYSYIKSYNLPEIKAKSVNSEEFRKTILKLNPDIILVGSWGEKFEKQTYDIPKIATINVHPSLLPKYRGPNPYFWVIKNQENKTGVTFHLMDERYDTGAILAQEEIKIYPNDTGKSLKERTVLTARGTACELLNALKEDIIIPLKQVEEKATYFSYPEDLELDFNKSAEENFATIRAIYPWQNTYFFHNNTILIPNPHKTSIEENKTTYSLSGTIVDVNPDSKTISILCANNKIIKMTDINFYKKLDRPFIKNYIKQEFKIGKQI